MKPSPPTEANDSCRRVLQGLCFWRSTVRVLLVIAGAICRAFLCGYQQTEESANDRGNFRDNLGDSGVPASRSLAYT